MEFRGVPIHPLVVHAAVVMVPLAAIAVVAFVVPRWRWIARWPALVLSFGAALSVQLAAMSGETLQESRGVETRLIEQHEEWAGRLQVVSWVLAGVMLVAFVVLPHVTRLVGGRDREARVRALTLPLTVLLPILVLAVVVLVFLTGDAGARSVWAGG